MRGTAVFFSDWAVSRAPPKKLFEVFGKNRKHYTILNTERSRRVLLNECGWLDEKQIKDKMVLIRTTEEFKKGNLEFSNATQISMV